MEEIKKEFEEKFIDATYFDENDPGCWSWKNVHYLDILKFIEQKIDEAEQKTIDRIFNTIKDKFDLIYETLERVRKIS